MLNMNNISLGFLESMSNLFDPNKSKPLGMSQQNELVKQCKNNDIKAKIPSQFQSDFSQTDTKVNRDRPHLGDKAETPYLLSLANQQAYNDMQKIIKEFNKNGNISETSSLKLAAYMEASLLAVEQYHKKANEEYFNTLEGSLSAQRVFEDSINQAEVLKKKPLQPEIFHKTHKTNSIQQNQNTKPESPPPTPPLIPSSSSSQTKSPEKLTTAVNPTTGASICYKFTSDDIDKKGEVKFKNPLQFDTVGSAPINDTEQQNITKILQRTEEIAFQTYLQKKDLILKNETLTNSKGETLDFAKIKNEYLTSQTDPDARNNATLGKAAEIAQKEHKETNPNDKTNYVFKFQIKDAPQVEEQKTQEVVITQSEYKSYNKN